MSDFWNGNVYSLYARSVDAIMSDIELMLDTLYTTTAATSQPAGSVGTQWYQNTLSLSTRGMRFKSYDTNWYSILTGSSGMYIWVHSNTASEGWIVSSTMTDCVLALRGAGGIEYKTTGGGTEYDGDWNISSLTGDAHTHPIGDHNHQVTDLSGSYTQTWNSAGTAMVTLTGTHLATGIRVLIGYNVDTSQDYLYANLYTEASGAGDTTGNASPTVSGTGSWRPKAAVGTLQYPTSPT